MFTLFGSTTPFDADVEKATSENNTTEQWDVIIDICDRAGANPKNAKDCLRSIMKRMGHNDPHVAIQAITLLDACIKNCGRTFHLEIASRDFETEFQRLMSKSMHSVAQKMRVSLKKWAENEFKTEHQLNLIPSLYQKLKGEGLDFSDSMNETPKPVAVSKDPNVVSSQQEEDDIAKAIELSLKEKNEGVKTISTVSASLPQLTLYPNMSESGKGSPKQQPKKDGRKVRALYDFEAAEDNELTFFSGEIIYVLDDSDSNWWTGYNERGEGLFPSNFVTADLNADIDTNRYDTKTNDVKSNAKKEEHKPEEIQIDEMKIDRLLHLLHEANPEDPSQDPEEMFILEAQVNQMLPLIDSELERVDRHHAKLTQLSTSLVEAINMYHMLMRESDIQTQFSPQLMRHPGQMLPNGMFNPFYSQIGGQFVNHSGTMPMQGFPQYQPNQLENNTHQSLQHLPPAPQTYVNQYQPTNEHHGQQTPGVLSRFTPATMSGVPNIQQQQTAHSMMPIHFQQQGVPIDGAHLNSQHSMPVEPSLNHNQYQPNTVMTTQVQQGIPQPVMVHHSSPNQQINPNAINQPVSSTILSQSNIPVFQQQR